MKLLNYKKNIVIISLFIIFNINIYCQENLIQDFFDNNPCALYYVGVRHSYLGSLFGSVFIDGNFEDNYTEALFIIPVDKNIGLCIEGDQQNVLDSFVFVYDPEIEKFRSVEDNMDLSVLSHRYNILNEITRIRLKILTKELISFSVFMTYKITID
jgi:hypothetical protein